jgi:hypothetical protein
VAAVCVLESCVVELSESGGACTVGGHGGTCDGGGTCVPTDECAVAADCNTSLVGAPGSCLTVGCVAGECVPSAVAASTPCTLGLTLGTCDDGGICIPLPCALPNGTECNADLDCELRHGSAGECRAWRCGSPNGMCALELAAEATQCYVLAGDGCMQGLLLNGTSTAGLCTASGDCVLRAARVSPALCEFGQLAYIGGQCSLTLGGIGNVCDVDADCGSGLATGCMTVRCSEMGSCELAALADDSPCVPAETDQPGCTVAQIGTCQTGRCVVIPSAPGTYCLTDAVCAGSTCYANGTCEILTGENLPCSIALPACSSASVCNGRGECVFGVNPACDRGESCTIYGCNVTTGECTATASPDPACGSLPVAAIAAIVMGSLVVTLLVLTIVVSAVMWPTDTRHVKPH